MDPDLKNLVDNFEVDGIVNEVKPLGEGFINDTFIVKTEGNSPDYILQRKNQNIFPDVPAMMDNIEKVSLHIKGKVNDPLREAMTVVRTKDGKLCHEDCKGDFWAMTVFIDQTIAYNNSNSPALAFKGGKGIGHFQALLSDFNEPLAETIKGFHNIRFRFQQWDNALSADVSGRVKDLTEEIKFIEERRKEMLDFWSLVEKGEIPARVTHNDTKINNILFDKKGEVLCVIDLDTVMTSTWLNDFGDAIRSYCNTGAEDDKDLSKVGLSLEMFEAYADGYLSEMATKLSPAELEWLAFSARYITYEQVLRFLMDYIEGDHYYKIKYADHNLVRTYAQMALLKDMESKYSQMCDIINTLKQKYVKD